MNSNHIGVVFSTTHIYIYIERERERERESNVVIGGVKRASCLRVSSGSARISLACARLEY
jgi:hypothetical protein